MIAVVIVLLVLARIETYRSDNGYVHENFADKIDSASLHTISRLSQVAQLLKRREFIVELKRGDRARVQTEMADFIALPFLSSKKFGNFTS